MNKNYMEEVAKMLGVEISEEFNLTNSNNRATTLFNPYMITEDGLICCQDGRKICTLWDGIVEGKIVVEKLPFKPKKNEVYYFIDIQSEVDWNHYNDDETDLLLMSIGNCFKNKKEAEKNKNAIINKYKEIRKSL